MTMSGLKTNLSNAFSANKKTGITHKN